MESLKRNGIVALLLLAGVLFWYPGLAQEQEASEPPASEAASETDEAAETVAADESVEEIIVVAPRPGARRDMPREYEDPMRARLLRELYESRRDQAELARMAAEAEENEGRVRFGYDPSRDRDDLEEEMLTPQRETTRPATIFSIEF